MNVRKVLSLLLACAAAGCASKNEPAVLGPQSFYTPQHRVMPMPAEPTAARHPGSGVPVPGSGSEPVAVAPPSPTPPATQPSLSTGSYMLVGTVIGEVNGQPLYADKILAKIDPALQAKALQANPKLGPDEFRRVAIDLIDRQVLEDVNEELFFAAALRNTSEQEQTGAWALTMIFRAREITRAGGSEAVARANSLRDGIDFEERVQQEYRRNMVRIYLSRKVYPRVQVTADDRREFYARNPDLFTEKAAIRFRMIRIGVRERAGADAAADKIGAVRARALRGEDFGKIAASRNDNDDANLAKNRGYLDMVDMKDESGQVLKNEQGEAAKEGAWYLKGSLANEELEKALFALQPGQITEIMKQGEYFFIAKLEEKKDGRVLAFEEPEVQEGIANRLRREQERALQDKEIAKLRNASVLSGAAIRASEPEYLKQIQPAIEMAMQKYHWWNRQQPAVSAR